MFSAEPNPNKRYIIGVIGDIPALLTFWQMFKEQSNEDVLREIGIVAAALPSETFLPEVHDQAHLIPTYASFRTMLEKHPEINMVVEATGRNTLVHELRKYLPPSITLVEKGAASFFINLLTENKIWVACKLDLLHTQNMLKTIVDQMDHEILFLDSNGLVVDANKTVLDRSGLPKKAIIGQSYCNLFLANTDPECGYDRDPFEQTMETGLPSETRTAQVDAQGRMQYFRVYTQPVTDEDDTISHVVAIRRNITQRTSMEHRLQQAEKLASIGELSTYMAHEIRNPLFTISGFANSLMREPNISEQVQEKLGIILAESKRLDEILKSLLNFTRPTEAQVAEVDINEIVQATMDIMRLPFQNQGVVPTMNIDHDIARVKANPDLIKQCLINLIKNSMEAMETGGELSITTSMNADSVILEVKDTGHGIPTDIRDKVFSPFFSTRNKGSGLGLAQTHKILDELGGRVELTSVEEEGTTITLHLPPLLAVAEEDEDE